MTTTLIQQKHPSKILEQYKPDNSKKHVLLLMGGESAEREVSLISGRGISKALKEKNYQTTSVDVGYDIANIIEQIKPDVVFNALHGTFGEDGNIQGILNILRIPYTHSGLTCSAICFNKLLTRYMVEAHGVNMAKCKVVNKGNINLNEEPMPRPYVIKPTCEGSSIGIEVVLEQDNFSFNEYQWDHGDELIIEEYIPGQEIQVAVIDGKAVGALEIKTHRKFYDYEAKYTPGGSVHIYPAELPIEKYQEVLSISEKVFNLLGCKDVSRVEYRYHQEQKKFYFLEVNTHPGFTPTSIVPEICAANGTSYNDLVEFLVEKADAVKL
ncbi:D-alanine--D-alanine ligase [Rickettsiales endosymbiont of Stachyamoeba lipophora]|uniref:D-alanine--D-alanine ligase n=1 Tax=Rickettsiales endosymbiont of Stachyamoeba lipophora TaxID=2486578 RepID=UPI000F651CEE|nr:D-alanine--D-alanine ligase [Rickettsiales endosymbiont of Stachyamoeba lipophora]AZL15464.1 D-alanine--D-alanine ligase [Rickettsiales endosymbiont of Stachyamoeba lipophora]